MAKTRTKAILTAPSAWWLTEGDEECPACGELYIYELEFRCPECDAYSCLHCRRRHSDGRWICVSCAEAVRREAR